MPDSVNLSGNNEKRARFMKRMHLRNLKNPSHVPEKKNSSIRKTMKTEQQVGMFAFRLTCVIASTYINSPTKIRLTIM